MIFGAVHFVLLFSLQILWYDSKVKNMDKK